VDIYCSNPNEHVNELCGEHAQSSMLDLLVHINTTRFQNFCEIIMGDTYFSCYTVHVVELLNYYTNYCTYHI